MLRSWWRIIWLYAALAVPAQLWAQADYPAYTMARTQVRVMHSAAGKAYRIYISRPESRPPESGYPVLFLLDGDDYFAVAAQTAERMGRQSAASGVEPGLVVAIGYPEENRRSVDYTPEAGPQRDAFGNPSGGAGEFRRFLRDELMPVIAGDFPVDASRRALLGHSYGGLFVLDTLLSEPGLFSTYIASSPSLWYADRLLIRELQQGQAAVLDAAAEALVVLHVGEYEQKVPPWAQQDPLWQRRSLRMKERKMVDDNIVLAQLLSAVPGLNVQQQVLAGETHGTTASSSIVSTMRLVFGAGTR